MNNFQKYLFFDTETTGLPQNFNAPLSDSDNWPRMVQIAWQLHDENGELIENQDYIIKPEGYDIPFNATRIHGISTKMAQEQGRDLQEVLEEFTEVLKKTKVVAGHNIDFDYKITNIILNSITTRRIDYALVKNLLFDSKNSKTNVATSGVEILATFTSTLVEPLLATVNRTLGEARRVTIPASIIIACLRKILNYEKNNSIIISVTYLCYWHCKRTITIGNT